MKSLINFAYSGTIKIDDDNVQDVLTAANYLQLNKVRDVCVQFLISRLV